MFQKLRGMSIAVIGVIGLIAIMVPAVFAGPYRDPEQ